MNNRNIPDSYVDCIVMNSDGYQRIARLNHDKTHWQLASYDAQRKGDYCWNVDDVVAFKQIDLLEDSE